ncbi:flagellin flab1 [hydrocarbon metagenome]|uniref:Flagellin flab1 n=1 Tax=hydrocarbon metagenome TaxID=938273 RepID=A0A0W8FFT5_9ZZZZ
MKIFRNEEGFTGLEAAIVLIAFVVVAAVFSYVVLGAGFFTTQKSQEVVHTGVAQASSSMEIIGNVYGINTSANPDGLTYVRFTVGNTAGGAAIDVKQMIITYIDESNHQVMTLVNQTHPNSTIVGENWNVTAKHNANDNWLLEPGEQFVIMTKVMDPGPNTQFTLNLQPAVGAVFPIKRTVPPAIDTYNILY